MLLLLSRVSLLVINLLTIQERVREKRQGMKLIWGPIYFQAVLNYYERFFHEIHSNNSLRDQMYKLITDFSIYECLHLTGPEVYFAFDVWKFLELICLVLRLFQVRLHIHPDIACCFRFNGMAIVECYLSRHCVVNWSSQLEALILRRQLSSFDPCHYLLLLIQIVKSQCLQFSRIGWQSWIFEFLHILPT